MEKVFIQIGLNYLVKYEFAFIEGFEVNYSYSKHDQNSYYGSDYYQLLIKIFFSHNSLLDRKYGNHDLLFGAVY